MKRTLKISSLLCVALPLTVQADCLSGDEVAQNSDVTLYEQVSYVNNRLRPGRLQAKIPTPVTTVIRRRGLASIAVVR
ncbi:Uncharacterised protein [Escherichia coli]|nr:Uncharacterised protein [Escherichia coli]